MLKRIFRLVKENDESRSLTNKWWGDRIVGRVEPSDNDENKEDEIGWF